MNKFYKNSCSILLSALLGLSVTGAAVLSAPSHAAAPMVKNKVLNADDFNLQTGGADNTYAMMNLIKYAKSVDSEKIIIPKGEYHFYPAMAHESYTFISNNDEGLKRIVFPLFSAENLEIDGQGSSFIFHGDVNPFVLQDAKNIVLKNFSIDYQRSFHSEGKILAVGKGYMDLHIPEAFPFNISSAGILEFEGVAEYPPGYPVNAKLERRKATVRNADYKFKRILEYDINTRSPAYQVKDIGTGSSVRAEKIAGYRNIRIFHPALKGTVGNIMAFASKHRKYPAIVVSDSADVTLDNVTIHHAGGMGVLGQRCHNFMMQNSKVTPSAGRIVSATADATHFNNCTGYIKLVNNLFENQQDDATNIHGIYAMFYQLLDKRTAFIQTQHPQQWGFDFIHAGDELELVQGPSMITYGTNRVVKAQRISKEMTKVTFAQDIDSRIQVGDAVAEVRDYPDILIKGNTIRRNRARGMLLNCRGNTIVEDNYFAAPGSAILFEGDAHNWYEQGGVRNAIIRNNVFDNNHYSDWGTGVIAVAAGIADDYKETARYNKNILIENNTFNVFDKGWILNLFSVDGLTFRNNVINKTTAYPERKLKGDAFYNVQHSDNVSIEDNNRFNNF